jgi:hypothetical protein
MSGRHVVLLALLHSTLTKRSPVASPRSPVAHLASSAAAALTSARHDVPQNRIIPRQEFALFAVLVFFRFGSLISSENPFLSFEFSGP